MHNNEIYKALEDEFSAFNMPFVCNVMAEYFNILSKNTESKAIKAEKEYEQIWWKSSVERSEKIINEQ